MKIAIVTDAWMPQVNGVVRTLKMTCRELEALGHEGGGGGGRDLAGWGFATSPARPTPTSAWRW